MKNTRTNLVESQMPAIRRGIQLLRKQLNGTGYFLKIKLSTLQDAVSVGLGYGSYKDLLATSKVNQHPSEFEHVEADTELFKLRRRSIVSAVLPLLEICEGTCSEDYSDQVQSGDDDFLSEFPTYEMFAQDRVNDLIPVLEKSVALVNWCPPAIAESVSSLKEELNRLAGACSEHLTVQVVSELRVGVSNPYLLFSTSTGAQPLDLSIFEDGGYSKFSSVSYMRDCYLLTEETSRDGSSMWRLEFNQKHNNRNILPQWSAIWSASYRVGEIVVLVKRNSNGHFPCEFFDAQWDVEVKDLEKDRQLSVDHQRRFHSAMSRFGYSRELLNAAAWNSISTDNPHDFSA
ncbi:hypothetical protein VCHA53O466_140191 [Vibrio chagasii]|nr:hypothetical protein VCHA53O466_140191 [Vibrio chagasii]